MIDGCKKRRSSFKRVCHLGYLLLWAFSSIKGQGFLCSSPRYINNKREGLIRYVSLPFLMKPVITASSQDICPGTTVIFTASLTGATGYLWYINGVSTGATSATYSYGSFKDQDRVTCYVTDVNGGALSDPLTITVGDDRKPVINISGSTNICKGTSVTFTSSAFNGGSKPVYQWKVNGVIVSGGPSYTTSTFNNQDAVSCVLISNAHCIIPTPVSSPEYFMNVSDVVMPAGKIIATAKNFCEGTIIDFSVNMTIGEPVSYQWKINGVNVSTNLTFNSANLADKDIVSCDMIVNTQCSTGIPYSPLRYKVTVTPYVKADVVISSSAPDGVCPRTAITFTAVPNASAGNTVKYQWRVNNVDVGTNNNTFTSSVLNDNDVVTCKVTPQNVPCLLNPSVVSNTLTVKIYALPVINIQPVQKIIAGGSIVLSPIIIGDVGSYLWSPATGLSSTTDKSPVARPTVNTVYTLKVTSTNGCTATGKTTVNLSGGNITVKNTFTPNGDGINDTWEIPNLVNYSSCTVAVYNRYGTKVYYSVGYPNAWDGKFNNNPLPQGTYYYVIDLKDGSAKLSGAVTIIR